jgi:hypothetical protein
MRALYVTILMISAALIMVDARADPVSQDEVQRAQGAMLARIELASNTYARKIGLELVYVAYCNEELYLKKFQHPANGQIPFGVNYREIRDSKFLELVVHNREVYETSFMFLCLANAKNVLRSAERP